MPQFGLLTMIIYVVMLLLSGGNTPLESMPVALQTVMQLVPSTPFVHLALAVLFRAAGFAAVCPQMAAMAAIRPVLFLEALVGFRLLFSITQSCDHDI